MSPLSIYYCIDFPETQDISVIAKCLQTHIQVMHPEYTVVTFERYIKGLHKNDDVVKNGLYTFNKMYNDLKLKTLHPTWFVYVSNGNIKQHYKNVCAILLNREPAVRLCYYSINKIPLVVGKNDTKETKMEGIKYFNKGLTQLFSTKNTIAYDNFT